MILFENAVIHSAQTSSTLLKGVLDLSIGQFSARIWLLRTENYCIPDFGIFGTKIWIFPICFHKHITRYFIVLLDTSMDFQILLRTFQYFLGLLGTSVLLKYRSTLVPPCQFDTVYHEHVSFFTAHSSHKIAELVELKIVNFEITPIHGRSCLMTFKRVDNSNVEEEPGTSTACFYVK